MTFIEIDEAMKAGKVVYYQTKDNKVVCDDAYDFSFPWSPYAVHYADGSLGYMAYASSKDFPEFFMEA